MKELPRTTKEPIDFRTNPLPRVLSTKSEYTHTKDLKCRTARDHSPPLYPSLVHTIGDDPHRVDRRYRMLDQPGKTNSLVSSLGVEETLRKGLVGVRVIQSSSPECRRTHNRVRDYYSDTLMD